MHSLKGSIEGLQRQLRAIKFQHHVNFQGMILGHPSAFVEFYRHLLCNFNVKLTSYLVERGFGITGTTDYRCMEIVYRILRDVLSLKPSINLTQFFTNNFSERKLEMATLIAQRLGSLIEESDKNKSNTTQCPKSKQQNSKLKYHRNDLCKSVPNQLPGVYLFGSDKKIDPEQFDQKTTPINDNHFEEDRHHLDRSNFDHHQSVSHLDSIPQPNFHSISWLKQSESVDSRTVTQDSHNLNRLGVERNLTVPDGCEESRASGANNRQYTLSVHSPKNRCRSWTPSYSNHTTKTNADLKRSATPKLHGGNSSKSTNSKPHSASVNRIRTPAVRSGSCLTIAPPPLLIRTDSDKRNFKGDLASGANCLPINQKPCGDQETLDNILSSLSQLTDKVDSILSRMNCLENHLNGVGSTQHLLLNTQVTDKKSPSKRDTLFMVSPKPRASKHQRYSDSNKVSPQQKSLGDRTEEKPISSQVNLPKQKPLREFDGNFTNQLTDNSNIPVESANEKHSKPYSTNFEPDAKISGLVSNRNDFVSKLFEPNSDSPQNSITNLGLTENLRPIPNQSSSSSSPLRNRTKKVDNLDLVNTWRRYPPGLRTLTNQIGVPVDDTTLNLTPNKDLPRRPSSVDRSFGLNFKEIETSPIRNSNSQILSPLQRPNDRKLFSQVGDENSYRDQVQRITTMLTETQTLLDDRNISNFPFKPDDLINVMD